MSKRRKGNSTLKNFIAHSRELRESPAWRALPDNARRLLDRLELEHMLHGGAENGRLPVTYSDFEEAGLRRKSISLAIRQCVALGFLEITRRGGRSIAHVRPPSLYRLTYVHGRGGGGTPTDEWRKILTDEQVKAAIEWAAQTPQKPKAGRKRPSYLYSRGMCRVMPRVRTRLRAMGGRGFRADAQPMRLQFALEGNASVQALPVAAGRFGAGAPGVDIDRG